MKKYYLLFTLSILGFTYCSSPEKPFESNKEEMTSVSVSEKQEVPSPESDLIDTSSLSNAETILYQPSDRAYQNEGAYQVYKGTIGGLPITMHLIQSQRFEGIDPSLKEFIHGYYYYDKYQHPIHLVQYHPEADQEALEGKVVLYESYQSIENPRLVGTIDDYNNRFTGFWENDFTGKKLPFELIKEFNLMEAANLNEFHSGDFIQLDPENEDSPKAACNFSMLFPSEYNDLEGSIESCYGLIVPKMTGEPASPFRDNPLEKLAQVRAEYLQEQLNKYQEEPEYTAHFNELTRYMSVLWNEDERICLGFFTHSYTGGAHGNHGTEYYNMDLKTGKILKLQDVFTEGYEQTLSAALDRAARRQYDIPDESQLNEVFNVDKLLPVENFVLTNKGILFNYAPYEIAAYSLGQVELFVPFSDLNPIVKRDNILIGLEN